jgi:hypothetical protein
MVPLDVHASQKLLDHAEMMAFEARLLAGRFELLPAMLRCGSAVRSKTF